MKPVTHPLGIFVHLQTSFEDALQRTVAALKTEGFGVLTEIDVQDTLRKKLGVEHPPHRILGACNPPLAHRALTAAPEIGLLLPCNVTVRQLEENLTEVALIDPLMMSTLIHQPEVARVAAEAREKLLRVSEALKE